MIVSHLQTLVVTFTANIRPYLSGVASVIRANNTMTASVSKTMTELSNLSAAASQSVKSSMDSAMATARSSTVRAFGQFKQMVAAKIAEIVQSSKAMMAGIFNSAPKQRYQLPANRNQPSLFQRFWSDESSVGFHELANAFQTLGRYTTSAISNLTSFRGVLSSIRSVASSVYTGMTSLGRSIGVGLSNATSMASRGMSALGTSIANTFRAFPGIVSSAVRSASGYLTSFFTQMSVSIHNAGMSLEERLWLGLLLC